MKPWAWPHLPPAVTSALAATSTKTVVVAGLLVGMTTTATAGVVVLGSSAVRPPANQGQQTVPHLGATGELGGTPVVVVPHSNPTAAATAEPASPTQPSQSGPAAPPSSAPATETGAQPASHPQVNAEQPVPPAAPPAQVQAPTAAQPSSAPAAAPPLTTGPIRPAATSATPKTPNTPTTPAPKTPAPETAPTQAATATYCGTITDEQAERAVTAQYNCGPKNPAPAASADRSGGDQPPVEPDSPRSRGNVHRR